MPTVTYTSAISRKRRIVDRMAAAAGVLSVCQRENRHPPIATHDTCQAPPATVFLHALHDQMPIECRLTVFLPQNEHAVRRVSRLRRFDEQRAAHCISRAARFPSS
jgi:hypothetical protein